MKTVKVRLLRMVVFFPLLFLVPFFSFCDAAYGAEKVVLQLRWDHQFQFAGYYAAVWQGYYREAGLDVEIRSAITPEHKILRAVEEVAEGRADFGVGAADILVARDKGAPLVLLAVIFQQSAARFYALEKTDLNSPADLLRLRVARNVNDLIDVELQAMLRAEGIDPTKVKAYPHQPGIDHLVDGRVDVIPGYSTTMPYYGERRDALTGLLNRRSLEDMLNRTIARAKRGTASSLVYMDLDNFKDVNDTIGHAAGDEVLITLTGLLRAELRTEDVVFRLGGDEFAILLDGIDGKEALPAAERLRAIVAAHRFELKGRVFPLSLSIGLIEIEGALATGELLSQADAAMYRAKEQGKNRVVMA